MKNLTNDGQLAFVRFFHIQLESMLDMPNANRCHREGQLTVENSTIYYSITMQMY